MKLENHQWMLKLVGENLMRNGTFIISRCVPINYLLITKAKTSSFMMMKRGGHHLNQ